MAGVFITSEFENKIYEVIRMCEKPRPGNSKWKTRATGWGIWRDIWSRLELRDVEWADESKCDSYPK